MAGAIPNHHGHYRAGALVILKANQRMTQSTTNRCDSCGAVVPIGQAKCSFCGQEAVVLHGTARLGAGERKVIKRRRNAMRIAYLALAMAAIAASAEDAVDQAVADHDAKIRAANVELAAKLRDIARNAAGEGNLPLAEKAITRSKALEGDTKAPDAPKPKDTTANAKSTKEAEPKPKDSDKGKAAPGILKVWTKADGTTKVGKYEDKFNSELTPKTTSLPLVVPDGTPCTMLCWLDVPKEITAQFEVVVVGEGGSVNIKVTVDDDLVMNTSCGSGGGKEDSREVPLAKGPHKIAIDYRGTKTTRLSLTDLATKADLTKSLRVFESDMTGMEIRK